MESKVWIVAQREAATRIKKKSFIIMTILMPFLMAGLVFLPLLLSMIGSSERMTVAVIDNTGKYAEALKSNDDYLFVPTDRMRDSFRSDSTDVGAVVQITADLVDFPHSAAIFSQREVPMDLRGYVESALTEKVREEKFSRYDIPELSSIIDDVQKKVEVSTIRWTDEGEQSSMSEVVMVVGMILTFLIYMFVLSYGSKVMQGVMEEKTNRIVELMVSSVKPVDLLLGKIIGIGLVGIFQMLIWGLLLAVLLVGGSLIAGIPMMAETDMQAMAAAGASADMAELAQLFTALGSLPVVEIIVLFVLYFIGGYLLYASILAAFGAAVNDQQDSQQLMLPVMVIMMFAFYAGFYSADNPEGPFAFWMSFFPFTSSIVMMVRIPFGVPVWQELLSVALLFATDFFILWISAKIYRVGILMYGKKISFKEMCRWVKMS